jgi:hypothetical protein
MTAVMRHAGRMLSLFCVLAFAAGCVTEIYAPTAQNPPPSRSFHEFGKFRLEPVALNPAYAKHGSNLSATAAIDRNPRASLLPHLAAWDKGEGPSLVIQPRVEEIKFIGGGARFWAGAFAGSSAVVMRITYTDEGTGAVVASPVFYQHASAMGGAWTVGGSDNAMLSRVANLITTYTMDNYAAAVGGPTGAPTDRVLGS